MSDLLIDISLAISNLMWLYTIVIGIFTIVWGWTRLMARIPFVKDRYEDSVKVFAIPSYIVGGFSIIISIVGLIGDASLFTVGLLFLSGVLLLAKPIKDLPVASIAAVGISAILFIVAAFVYLKTSFLDSNIVKIIILVIIFAIALFIYLAIKMWEDAADLFLSILERPIFQVILGLLLIVQGILILLGYKSGLISLFQS